MVIRSQTYETLACDIRFECRGDTRRAVYLVEANGDICRLNKLFADLAPRVHSIQLSSGRLISFAVEMVDDESLLDDIERFIKDNFTFVIMHRSINKLILDAITYLCTEFDSNVFPITRCASCLAADPFPHTTLTLLDYKSEVISQRVYCRQCTDEMFSDTGKQLIAELLQNEIGYDTAQSPLDPTLCHSRICSTAVCPAVSTTPP